MSGSGSESGHKVAVIGCGALGGVVGGLLAAAGGDIRFIEIDRDVVEAVRRNGLRIEGACGDHCVTVPIAAGVEEPGWADTAIVLVTTNDTAAAAKIAEQVLKPAGVALTLQNGIGNVECLVERLGPDRVLGGSVKSSAQRVAPGASALTKLDPTSVGELDGSQSARAEELARMLDGAGLQCGVSDNILGVIWSKLVHNVALNAICAATGLRHAETAGIAELEALRGHIVAEALAVAHAKGIRLSDPDPLENIRAHARRKFTRPSMMQHVEAGRLTEIDAINGAIVREAAAHGIPTPYNEALVALLKGREFAQRRALHAPVDYAALQAVVDTGGAKIIAG